MSRAALVSDRGPQHWGLRLRGVAVIVVVALLAAVAWQISRPNNDGKVEFSVAAAHIGDGVSADTTVRLRGMSIGSVSDVRAEGPRRQVVTLAVDQERVHELSTAMHTRFVSANVFGSTALELIPRPGGVPITPSAVLELGDVGNYTVTTILRDSGRLLLDVVNKEFADSIDSSVELTHEMAPLLASALLMMRSMARARHMPLSEMLPKMADVSEGVAAFTPPALGTLNALASVDELDDENRAKQASATITEVSNLVMAVSGKVVGALGPTSHAVDMVLDLLIPMNRSLSNAKPEQVARITDGLDGALHQRGDRVVLGADVLVDTFPAFRVPLEATGGQR